MALNTNLAFDFFPEKNCCGPGVFSQFLSLPTLIIGVKDKATFVETFKEHGACRWFTILRCSSKSHGIKLKQIGCQRIIEPDLKLLQWVSVNSSFAEVIQCIIFSL